ncbi:glutamate receptor 1-like isoform X2 [Varroa jacobsoni]|nr:glutamate receptor 1-like isoform X2 [Varroa jacobsoni]
MYHVYVSCVFLLAIGAANAVKIGVIMPPGSAPAKHVFEAIVSPYNGSRPSPEGDFKVGSFFAEVAQSDIFSATRELCDQLRHQVTSVVISLPLTSSALQGLFKGTNVPYISTTYQDHCRSDLHSSGRRHSPPADNLGLSLLPDVIPAIADTIDHFGWSSFIYLYDSDSGTQKLQRLLNHKYQRTNAVTMRYAKRVNTPAEANVFLRAVDLADRDANKYVILDVPFARAKEIIVGHARDPHVGKRNFHFVLAQPVSNELQHQLVEEFSVVSITAFKMTSEAEAVRKFFENVPRSDDPSQWSEITEEKITADQALLHDAAQIIVTAYKELRANGQIPRKHSDVFEAFLRIDNPPATCDVEKVSATLELGDIISRHIRKEGKWQPNGLTGSLEFNNDGCRKNYVIDVIRLAKDGSLIQFAQWESGKGFSLVSQRIDRQKELKLNRERTYIISTLFDEPFLFLQDRADGQTSLLDPNKKFQGYLADLAQELAKVIGFRYELRVAKDGELGAESNLAPGGWGGVVGEIMRGEADFGLVSRPQSKLLRDVVEYSQPFLHTGIAAIASKKSSPDCIQILLTFLRPFGWPLWIMLASSFGIVFLLMFIFSLCIACADSKKSIEHATSFCDDLYNSLNFTIDTFTPHYLDSYYARSIAGRVISNFWWVFILLVYSAYTAQLVPLLRGQRATLEIFKLTNISQLANQEAINYGYSRGSIAETYFQALRTTDEQLEAVAHKLRRNSHSEPIDSDDEGVAKVRESNGSFVFFLDSNKADFINSRAPCDTFRVQGVPLGIQSIGAILPKDSYLRQEIDNAITKLYERGVLDELRSKWWLKKANCSLSHRKLPVMGSNLHLYNFVGVLAIPAAGIAVGFVLAFFEICYRACTRGRQLRQLKRQQLSHQTRGEAEPGFSDINKDNNAATDDSQLNLQPAYTTTA